MSFEAPVVIDSGPQMISSAIRPPNRVLMRVSWRGLLVLESNALGQATRYRYDDAGRMQEVLRANGARLTFEFDDGGRLVRRQAFKPDGGLETTDNFQWEAGDRLTGWSNDNAQSVASFDDAGRLLSETVTVDGASGRVRIH